MPQPLSKLRIASDIDVDYMKNIVVCFNDSQSKMKSNDDFIEFSDSIYGPKTRVYPTAVGLNPIICSEFTHGRFEKVSRGFANSTDEFEFSKSFYYTLDCYRYHD